MRAFLSDRLNAAWVASAAVLAVALLVVPNEGVGTVALIALALPAIGLTGALRIRDARRDRARRDAEGKGRRGRLG